jgi:hypothetical protein
MQVDQAAKQHSTLTLFTRLHRDGHIPFKQFQYLNVPEKISVMHYMSYIITKEDL